MVLENIYPEAPLPIDYIHIGEVSIIITQPKIQLTKHYEYLR